jgi:hypothetical protein
VQQCRVAYGGRSSWETRLEAWKWVLDVNLMGVIHGIQTFLPIMLAQNTEAHVVNKWGQTLIIDLIRLYFCLISDCLDISDLTILGPECLF